MPKPSGSSRELRSMESGASSGDGETGGRPGDKIAGNGGWEDRSGGREDTRGWEDIGGWEDTRGWEDIGGWEDTRGFLGAELGGYLAQSPDVAKLRPYESVI